MFHERSVSHVGLAGPVPGRDQPVEPWAWQAAAVGIQGGPSASLEAKHPSLLPGSLNNF